MNRSFSQRQEIDCTCFDFNLHTNVRPRQQQTASKPFLNARELNTTVQESPKQKNLQKCAMKKSLKGKFLNQSLKQSLSGPQKPMRKIMRNESTNTDWIPQDRWALLAEGSILEKKKNKQNLGSLQQLLVEKNNQKIKRPGQKDSLFSEPGNIKIIKKQDLVQRKNLNSFFQPFEQPKTQPGSFKKNKTSINNIEPSQTDSYSKTIKKRHSILSSNYRNTEVAQKYEQKRDTQPITPSVITRNIDEELVKNFKRISIRGELTSNFTKKLEYILPKEIESFEEEDDQSIESEVLEKGRYTWAPDSAKKVEGPQFISSLHIRDTSRASRVSGNRPSKMVITHY